MAYLIPDPPSQGSRLIAAYDVSRRALLDRGVSISEGPDLAELRRYLEIRQRAEEMAAAEQALAEGVTGRRRRRFGTEALPEATDPQLRPVSWAVPLRGDRRDLEDTLAHRGLQAHAYYVDSASTDPAVCGFKPRTKRVPGGGRVACLTPACTEQNSRCPNCLVLLYGATLTGRVSSGPWPTVDETEPAAAAGTAAVAEPDSQKDGELISAAHLEIHAEAQPAAGTEDQPSAGIEDEPSGLVELPAPLSGHTELLAEPDAETPAETYLVYPPYREPLEAEPAGVAEAAAQAHYEAEPAAEHAAPQPISADVTMELPIADVPAEPVGAAAEPAVSEPSEHERGPIVIPITEDWDAEHEDILAAEQQIHVRVEEFAEVDTSGMPAGAEPLEALLDEGISDVLVVVAAGRTAMIAGGIGRGTDWAGTVLDMDHEQMLRDARDSDGIVHRDWPEPQRIAGPYWARSVVLVPVDDSSTVIFGSPATLELHEQTLLDAARTATERFKRPAPDVALDDEREVAIAIKRIMEGSDLSFEAALDHVLTTATSVLGCSLAAGYARMGRRMAMRAMDLDGSDQLDPAGLLGSQAPATWEESISVEEVAPTNQHLPGVVSRLRVPIKGNNVQGLLVLTHTSLRPRGFTTQDQRLAEAIAPAAVLVLERAGFGEGLRALESHLRSAPAADPLTGVANEAAWEEALAGEADRLARYGGSAAVAAFRVDGLSQIDQRQGPQARDAALRQAVELVRGVSRSTDLVARVGEDEFRILIRNSGNQGGRRLATRVRRAARNAQATDDGLPPLTISWANARSHGQLLQASRLVAQRLRARTRVAEVARIGSDRPN